ncbi:TPA: GNAT family N-acetyltransferase [Pasteurella multocida]|nr:GNAT family N-acetyltransferase [Pasteurella multocida]
MVKIVECQQQHFHALSYSLSPEQAKFTALPSVWFADLNAKKPWKAFSILSDDEPVGFFVLDQGEDRQKYSDNPQAVLLRSMSIHPDFQGLGIAKQALSHQRLMPLLLHHFPSSHEIVLGVNHLNQRAYAFYLTCGFKHTQRELMGIRGKQYILSLDFSICKHS